MTQTRRFAFIALAFLCLEALLIAFVDRPLSEYLRTIDSQYPALIDFFRAWTDLGKSKWYLWPSGLGIVLCALLARRKSPGKAARNKIRHAGEFLLFLFVCVAASGTITDIIKPILGRARPVELQQDTFYGFHPLSFAARWNSMPSGHATTGFALAFVVAGAFPRLRILAFFLAVALAISRVMVNAHFLSDILAGGMVGFLTVLAAERLRKHNGICHINHSIFPIDGRPHSR